jgi:uncharacterized membrane protein YbhN (UPF0104 family)
VKAPYRLAARVALSASLLLLVLRSVDPASLSTSMLASSKALLLVAAAIYLLGVVIKTLRWSVLLRESRTRLSFVDLLRLNLVGLVLNAVLPSGSGGDAYRLVQIVRSQGDDPHMVGVSTLLDRWLGVTSLAILLGAGVLFSDAVPGAQRLAAGSVAAVVLLITAALFSPWRGSFFALLVWVLPSERLRRGAAEVGASLERHGRRPDLLLAAGLLSVAFQVLAVVNQWVILRAVGAPVELGQLLVAIPLLQLILLLPISVGGVGVREAALIQLLGDVPRHQVVAYGVFAYSLFLVALAARAAVDAVLLLRSVLRGGRGSVCAAER